ncbi:CBR1 [Symbiodinium sp. CCMP2592]|nr:CBR1 [Symbiodinium sp. CCMP2592]
MARLAVVTGANKGVGFYVARQLQEAGLRVVIACRSPERGSEAARRLGCEFEVLDLGSDSSIEAFASTMETKYQQLDVLVNNAAIAFKAADPTPFKDQTVPTLAINFFATMRLTDRLLPLLRGSAAAGREPRVVNVASMAGKLRQLSPALQSEFASPMLDRPRLVALVQSFVAAVQSGKHREQGWGSSNYGMSKLAVIAYTKMLAREEGSAMRINAICPGYCRTDMSSNRGGQSPEVGARTATTAALLSAQGPTGAFFEHERESSW